MKKISSQQIDLNNLFIASKNTIIVTIVKQLINCVCVCMCIMYFSYILLIKSSPLTLTVWVILVLQRAYVTGKCIWLLASTTAEMES